MSISSRVRRGLFVGAAATGAVVLGAAAPTRLRTVPGTSGVLVAGDGTLHRWLAPA